MIPVDKVIITWLALRALLDVLLIVWKLYGR